MSNTGEGGASSSANTPPSNHHNGGSSGKADDLLQLIDRDLHFIEKSLEEAKCRLDQLIDKTKEVRNKYEELLLLLPGGMKESDLYTLKKKASNLKLKIPYSLIIPPSSTYDYQHSHPHINWRPWSDPRTVKVPRVSMHNLNSGDHTTKEELISYVKGLNHISKIVLMSLLAFPENSTIKRSLFIYWVKALRVRLYLPQSHFNEAVDDIISKGFIKPNYKKLSFTVGSYSMHPFIRSSLIEQSWLDRSWIKDNIHLGACKDDEDIIYSAPGEISVLQELRILHMGKWQKSATHHIEVEEPESFFKGMESLSELRYVSFSGISMLESLPQFITKLKNLEILDLKACYNLVDISSNISNLRHSLTHLDMSECYFLDHMPKALADLYNLEVLKGFFVGETEEKDSCTLKDLTSFRYLVKLNIYTSMEVFPNHDHLTTLQQFKSLSKLTISWGGCVTGKNSVEDPVPANAYQESSWTYPLKLEKLELLCVPMMVTSSWLRPTNFKQLKKLYISGGKLCDLGQGLTTAEEEYWGVEMLRLNYLSKLEVQWSKVQCLFPNLISLQKVECPNLNSFPCGENGMWMNTTKPPKTTSASIDESVHSSSDIFFSDVPTPTFQDLTLSLQNFNYFSKRFLLCFLVFPENAIIKRSLLFCSVTAQGTSTNSLQHEVHQVVDEFTAKGFIKPVYKKCNLRVGSYWMHPYVRSTLKNQFLSQVPCPSNKMYLIQNRAATEDQFISSHSLRISNLKELEILHLGRWQRSEDYRIELDDPDLTFKDMKSLNKLTFISFRGILRITELPEFITELMFLEILDVKACHNLEVIPSDIGKLQHSLTHLDMSECYFLDHMPASISELKNLRVLKGFIITTTNREMSCTLQDLVSFHYLTKLQIYTTLIEFPNEDQLTVLQELKSLRSLTISWGGVPRGRTRGSRLSNRLLAFSFQLEKLDLQCTPETVTSTWLRPANFKQLKKLYIRGSKIFDLRCQWQDQEEKSSVATESDYWNVELLRLKYLSELKMDWSEVGKLTSQIFLVMTAVCGRELQNHHQPHPSRCCNFLLFVWLIECSETSIFMVKMGRQGLGSALF